MSTTIDERVVEMRLDNKNFEKNANTSIDTLGKLEQKLNLSGAAKGFQEIDSASKKINFSAFGNAVETVTAKFSALQVMGVTALANITNSAVNAGKRIVSALTIDPIKTGFSEYETQINAVQTILANTQSKGKTLQDVNTALDELNTYADKTIYNFTEMTRNIGTFTAAGVDLDKSVTSIKGIANLAAVSGSTSQQASTAMYQLSQALAAGRVSLMDWNSVVNAGMGGQLFQDALKRTATNMGHDVDAIIKKYGSFRESLTQGEWLTADVLTETLTQLSGAYSKAELMQQGYTEAQADEIVKLAETAVNAATKVKTLTQLWDTLKESAQSGWTQTWEILIGDFEEAKELFTEISDTVGAMIGESANRRNNLLAGAFGADSANPFKDVTEATLKLSDAQLKEAGYTEKQIKQLRRLGVEAKTTEKPLSELIEAATRKTGRELVIESLWNVFNAAMDVITPVKEALREIFPPMTSNQLYELIEGFNKFTKSLKISEKTADKIKRTFKGVFAIVDIFKQVLGGIFTAIKPLFGITGDLGGGLLGLTANIGDAIVKFNEFLKSGDVFGKVGQTIADTIIFIKTKFSEFMALLKEKIGLPVLDILNGAMDRIGVRLESMKSGFDVFKSAATKAISAIGESFKQSSFLSLLTTLWEAIKKIGSGIGKALGSLFGIFSDKLGNAEFEGFFDLINTLIGTGIGVGLTKFLHSAVDTFKSFADLKDNVVDIFDGIGGCLEAYQTQLKAGTLIKIATAIGILALSIIALSFVDSEKLGTAVGAISMLFADLVGSMIVLEKFGGKIRTTTRAMIGIALSVFILAAALKKIADLPLADLGKGLLGVVGLTATMVGSMIILSKYQKKAIKGAVQMVIFAAAIKILASACEDLSTLSWEELVKGLVGVGILLAEVVGFLKFAKLDGKSMKTAIGIVILSAALKILAIVCKDFSTMKWEEIGKGLAAVGGLLAEVAIFTKLTGNAKKVISTGLSLILIAAAMKILAPVLQDLSKLSWEQIGKGLAALGGSLILIGAASRLMPKNMIGIGVGLLAVAGAVTIISNVLSDFGEMSWGNIAKGLSALGGSLLILAGGLFLMSKTKGGSGALLLAAVSLAVLVPCLKSLGNMSWVEIGKGLTVLAGAFVILGVAGLLLKPLVPAILGLAGAFALVGVSVLAIGAGLLLAGLGLSALAVGLTALGTSLASAATAIVAGLSVIVMGILGLIPAIVREFGDVIVAFCEVIISSAPAIGEAIKAIVLTALDVLIECVPKIVEVVLQIIVQLLASLNEHLPVIVDGLFQLMINLINALAEKTPELIQSGFDLMMSLFSGIVDALKSIDTSTLLEGIVGIGIVAAIMYALSGLAALAPGAMAGVLAVGAVIAEIAILLAAIGGLAQIPGLEWLINEGGDLLQSIGTAIGKLIGGLVGGIAEGAASSLPQIGTYLSEFMTNLEGFITGVNTIGEGFGSKVAGLAGAILALTAADLIAGIASFLSGGASLAELGTDLSNFMTNAKPFIDGASGISEGMMGGVKALADTILILTAANVLEGLTSWLTGSSSLETFGSQLPGLGTNLKDFAANLGEFNDDTVTTVTCASNAIKALAQAAEALPNEGGWAAKILGDNSIATFGSYLPDLGTNLASFAANLGTFDEATVATVTCAANAIKGIADAADLIPNDGGLWAKIAGDNSIVTFAGNLPNLGTNLKDFAGNLGTFDEDTVSTVNCAANAIKSMADAAHLIPNEGGLWAKIAGDNSIATFGGNLPGLGTNLKDFASNLGTFNDDKVQTVRSAVSAIGTFAKLADSDLKGASDHLGDFSEKLPGLATDISKFVTNMPDTSSIDAAISSLNQVLDAIKDATIMDTGKLTAFTESLGDLGKNAVTAFIEAFTSEDAETDVKTAAGDLADKLVEGVEDKKTDIEDGFVTALDGAPDKLKNKRPDFYDAGLYLAKGFASGISAGTYSAAAKASAMAKAAADAAKEALNINSPSRVFREIGTSVPEGFALGITLMGDNIETSADVMAGTAISAVKSSIARIADIVNNDIDTQPTIRPVVDLTDVRAGTSAISGMLDFNSRVRVIRDVEGINSTMANRVQNGANTEVVSAINKLRKDMSNLGNTYYTIDGVTYDDGSGIADAVRTITRAAIRERRV